MTKIEALVVVLVLIILAAMFLPALLPARRKVSKLNCVNHVKQIQLSFKTWAVDNDDKLPMEVSVTKGGAMEQAEKGNLITTFQIMSNELSATKLLVCPTDIKRTPATSFSDLGKQNISYFIGLDAGTNYPSSILLADDNLAVAGIPTSSGLLKLASNAPVEWTAERHVGQGNIGLANGTVHQLSSAGFRSYLTQNGLATNRLVIP